jgi:hypothetical protein
MTLNTSIAPLLCPTSSTNTRGYSLDVLLNVYAAEGTYALAGRLRDRWLSVLGCEQHNALLAQWKLEIKILIDLV